MLQMALQLLVASSQPGVSAEIRNSAIQFAQQSVAMAIEYIPQPTQQVSVGSEPIGFGAVVPVAPVAIKEEYVKPTIKLEGSIYSQDFRGMTLRDDHFTNGETLNMLPWREDLSIVIRAENAQSCVKYGFWKGEVKIGYQNETTPFGTKDLSKLEGNHTFGVECTNGTESTKEWIGVRVTK